MNLVVAGVALTVDDEDRQAESPTVPLAGGVQWAKTSGEAWFMVEDG
jgi:hypothetical protein